MTTRMNAHKCYVLPKNVTYLAIPNNLPANWLDDLGASCASLLTLDNPAFNLLKRNVQRHVGINSNYTLKDDLILGLRELYLRFSAKDTTLSLSAKAAIFEKLIEDIEQCTPGFHDRVNDIVAGFYLPEDLDDLLAQIRNNIVEKTARQNTAEVHAHNRFYVIALSLGYGVKQINAKDAHSGDISDEKIQAELKLAFNKHFQVPIILNELIEAIKGVLHSQYEYIGFQEKGYNVKNYTHFITYLEKIFSYKKPLSKYEYFILDEQCSIVDLNWKRIKHTLFEILVVEQYINLLENERNCLEHLIQTPAQDQSVDITCLYSGKFINNTTELCSFLSFLNHIPLPIRCALINNFLKTLNPINQFWELMILLREFKHDPNLVCSLHLLFKEVIATLQKNNDIDKTNGEGFSPAHHAALNGHTFIIAELAAHGADLNKILPSGETPLYLAAQNGHDAVIIELARNGANLNKTNSQNLTPAHIAAFNGHNGAIRELAKLGADLNKANSDGVTPAYLAAQKGRVTVISELAKNRVDLNKASSIGITPAFIAAKNGHAPIIAVLAKYNADLNKETINGSFPALVAAHEGHASVIVELAKYGVDFNKANPAGATPAHVAANKGHPSVIAELAKHNTDFNKTNPNGATPALMAAENDRAAIITELAKHKADFNKALTNGETPVFRAAVHGYISVLAELAKNNADLNKANTEGATPLFIAAQNGHTSAVALLIIYGAELNIPLRISVEKLRKNMGSASQEVISRMEEFIKQHVSLKSDKVSITPQDISKIMGHQEVAKLLSAHHFKELSNKLKPLDLQLAMLHDKVCEFQDKREQAQEQNLIEKEAIFNTAYNHAQCLFEILTTLKKQYQNNEIPYSNFKRQSMDAITSAEKELNKHRGWMEILGNIALCVAALAPIFKFLLTHSFFHFKTKSAVILEGLQKTIKDHEDDIAITLEEI